jgi:hypothetical protein
MYNIPEDLIGSRDNLRVLDAHENRKKSNFIVEIPDIIKEYIMENKIDVKNS